MAYLNPRVLDNGLEALIAEGTRVDLCSDEPVSFAEATSGLTLCNKTGVTLTGPADRSPTGRKAAIPAVTDGTVTATGTATHWAVSDPVGSRLLAAGALSASQVVTSGNAWSLAAVIDIGMPGVV